MEKKKKSETPAAASKEPRRAPVQERSRDTVNFIFDATTLALRECDGIEKLTMKDVARRAGVNDATLYRFFSTKAALLAAWEEHQIDGIIAEVLKVSAEMYEKEVTLGEGVRVVAKTAILLLSDLASLYGRQPLESILSRADARNERMQRMIDGMIPLVGRAKNIRPRDGAAAVEICVLTASAMSYARRYRLSREEIADQVADMLARYISTDAV